MSDYTHLREIVCSGNHELAMSGLVMSTFGNLSAIDRGLGVFAIKPSGIAYAVLGPDDIVIISIDTGEVVDGDLKPSSDTPTHLELYRAFTCSAIAHTHSEFATMYAQARVGVRCMGTTHADYFHGDVPVTRPLTAAEVETDYERNTGLVIVETFRLGGIVPEQVPAVLVANHGPFTWAADVSKAIENARALEFVARMDWHARSIAPAAPRPDAFLVKKHYQRKHGPKPSYGQK
jgi:L-ribulose-5-phosphate 4-epimerase